MTKLSECNADRRTMCFLSHILAAFFRDVSFPRQKTKCKMTNITIPKQCKIRKVNNINRTDRLQVKFINHIKQSAPTFCNEMWELNFEEKKNCHPTLLNMCIWRHISVDRLNNLLIIQTLLMLLKLLIFLFLLIYALFCTAVIVYAVNSIYKQKYPF